MGTEVLIAAALSAAAAGASAYNTRQTAKKQDNVAAQGIRQQAENQRQANARINKTLEEAKKSSPDEARNKAQSQYLQAIRGRQKNATAGLSATGVSRDFDQAATKSAADSVANADQIAGLMAAMDAPLLQRQAEGASYGNLGQDLDIIGGNVQGDNFLNQLRLRGVRRNPYLDAAAAAAGGYASGMSFGGGGTGGNAAVPYNPLAVSRRGVPNY